MYTGGSTALAEGRVLCPWRTMYRLLRADDASRERRAIRRHPTYTKPELLATMPNQVWSWDITLLRGPRPDSWYRLYVVVAALAATLVGTAVSMLLAREIVRPLRELAYRSQRIADGHYAERVAVPVADELADVAQSFNQMADALAQAEQQRVALIGTVAHELRTPLAGLEGYLEGLIDGVLPSDPQTIAAMQHEVRRLRRLVDDLQQLSRVEAGQVALQIETFDLLPMVQRVITQLRPQLMAQSLAMIVEVPGQELWVRADSDRTAQILVNLIGNAIRYTPDDGSIRVRIHRDGNQASVTVEDTGIGIPATALPYLFERFYRVDPSRSRVSGGSGIGLTIAHHLAWAMGGEITATSPGLGQGSTFMLLLPLGDSIV